MADDEQCAPARMPDRFGLSTVAVSMIRSDHVSGAEKEDIACDAASVPMLDAAMMGLTKMLCSSLKHQCLLAQSAEGCACVCLLRQQTVTCGVKARPWTVVSYQGQ